MSAAVMPAGRGARLLRNPGFVLGAAIVGFCAVVAILAPWIVPYDPFAIDLDRRLVPPSFMEGGDPRNFPLCSGTLNLILAVRDSRTAQALARVSDHIAVSCERESTDLYYRATWRDAKGALRPWASFLRASLDELHELPDLPARIAAARASDEGHEGATAFLEKRPPRWQSSGAS